MKLNTLTIINHSTTHKSISLILGILVWHMVSTFHHTAVTLSVPVCLFNTEEAADYCAPKQVEITLYGPKSELRTIDFENLAVHLNARQHADSHTPIQITSRNLLLPRSIQVQRHSPTNFMITKNKL